MKEAKLGLSKILRRLSGQIKKDDKPTTAKAVPVETTIVNPPETVVRKKMLGITFENQVAETGILPPVLPESLGAAGILETNEDLPDSVTEQVKISDPDGYIFGPGFGNILTMTLLYQKNQTPKAILALDILPEVVVTGRVLGYLLADSDDFLTFKEKLANRESLKSAYETILDVAKYDDIKERLKSVTFETMLQNLKEVMDREGRARINVFANIRENFDVLHQLALEGNIGVAYADITNPEVLKTVQNMPEFSQSQNIIYMSNVIDHLTTRGTDLSHINDMNVLKTFEQNGHNWFIDTTQQSLDYQLRAGRYVPQYTPEDVEIKYRKKAL